MLLVHQVGSVKIGEVIRYTVTYTPSQDRILPSPEKLHLRIRNTSAIALRAAFVHGPYTLSVAAYPSGFDPNEKFAQPRRYGVPVFEPMLKAGGAWEAELLVPDDIRQAAGTGRHGGFGKGPEHDAECVSWVVEVSSQVIFSASVAVGYDLVVARDRKSLDLGASLPVVGGHAQAPQPGRVSDYQQSVGAKDGHHPAQPRGVFSRVVHVKVEDTATLWNTPRLPGWDDAGDQRVRKGEGADEPVESMVDTGDPETQREKNPGKEGSKTSDARGGAAHRKQKKVHLVVLTHGLHSNLGADMLYLKETIDKTAAKAKVDAKARRERERAARAASNPESNDEDTLEEEDDEDVIVRGYSGNATKTERGIKYLGKRLARYVLSMTYPDQGYLPVGKGAVEGFAHNLDDLNDSGGTPAHKNSTIRSDGHKRRRDLHQRPYKITSISFIAHSLGGLVQTYAVAYIQKHSPEFFDLIRPMHFICLASPFLGLSNENPLYVKFALDFGLVGRTGKDLGLTWRAPTIARSGWGALVGNLGETAHKKVYGQTQPESKPLLRILPTGPAHVALKKFRNRTVYSNVVNDGIVPLRTSCLLFLDWQGLGRVEKARRDAGLVETVVGFGWAELTGTKLTSPRQKAQAQADSANESGSNTPQDSMRQVPQPDDDAVEEDERASLQSVPTPALDDTAQPGTEPPTSGPLSGFFNLFKSNEPPKAHPVSPKQKKILRRGQTIGLEEGISDSDSSMPPKVTAGNELEGDPEGMIAPPKTTFFESAGDVLNPKVADVDYLIDPSKRPRTIFHDRVYHPSDIPSLPLKKRNSSLIRRKTFNRASSNSQQSTDSGSSSPYLSVQREDSVRDYDDTANTNPDRQPGDAVDSTGMRVEEKIARGYHRDLSWRKVLVKLEPDAHNNIFVRRMFANAYGWPVVKHLVDVHFSDSAVARMSTEEEHLGERALPINQPPDEHGGETRAVPATVPRGPRLPSPVLHHARGDREAAPRPRNDSEAREALDELRDLPRVHDGDASVGGSSLRSRSSDRAGADRADSMAWSDRDWADSDSEGGSSDGEGGGGGGGKEGEGRSSPSWNWAEKIVGKGAARGKSPTREAEQ